MRARIQLVIAVIGMMLSGLTMATAAGAATGGPFSCTPNFYHEIGGQLNILNPVTGAYTQVGNNTNGLYNAIGYNTLDNYMYAMSQKSSTQAQLMRIASDGSTTLLGVPTGLPLSTDYATGGTDNSGNLYVEALNDIYKINIATNTATHIVLTNGPVTNKMIGRDFVFLNNRLYSIIGTKLVIINLSTNTMSTNTLTGVGAGGTFGAGWTDSQKNLFFSLNSTGQIFKINNFDTGTPNATQVLTGQITNSNDGASCSNANNPFPTTTTTSTSTTSTTMPTTTSTSTTSTSTSTTSTTLPQIPTTSTSTSTTSTSTTSTSTSTTSTSTSTTSTTAPTTTTSTTAPTTTTTADVADSTIVKTTTTDPGATTTTVPEVKDTELARTGFETAKLSIAGLMMIGFGIMATRAARKLRRS